MAVFESVSGMVSFLFLDCSLTEFRMDELDCRRWFRVSGSSALSKTSPAHRVAPDQRITISSDSSLNSLV